MIRQLEGCDPKAPRSIDRKIPRDLENVILKAISRSPEDRYRSAGQFAEDLDCFLNHRPVRARRVAQHQRLGRWIRRNPALAASMGTVLALLLLLATAGPMVAMQQRKKSRELVRTNHAASTLRAFESFGQGHLDRVPSLLWRYGDDPYAVKLRGFDWQHLWNRYRELGERPVYRTSLNGSQLASSSPKGLIGVYGQGDDGGLIELCDLTFAKVRQYRTPPLLSGDFVEGGRSFLGLAQNRTVLIHDLESGETTNTCQLAGESPQNRLLISRDQSYVATWKRYDGHCVELWAFDDLREESTAVPKFAFNRSEIEAVAFSRDSRYVAIAAEFGKITLHDLHSGETLETSLDVPGASYIEKICFHPDRSIVATSGTGLRVWDVSNGQLLMSLGEPFRTTHDVEFSNDGRQLYASGESQIEVWDLEQQELVTRLFGAEGSTREIVLVENDIIAHFSEASQIRRWKPPAFRPPHTSASFIDFVSDDRFLAISSNPYRLPGKLGTFRFWDLERERVVHERADAHYLMPSESPFRTGVIALPRNHEIEIWNSQEQRTERRLLGHQSQVTTAQFSPDGRYLASCSTVLEPTPGELAIWDLAEDVPRIRPLRLPHMMKTARLEFSPSGKLLYALAHSWTESAVLVYDVSSQSLIHHLLEDSHSLIALSLSPNGRQLAVGGYDRKIVCIDAQSGQQLLDIPTDGKAAVVCTAYSPDGKQLFAGFESGHVCGWDLSSGEQTSVFSTERVVYDLEFSGSGTALAAACGDGSVFVWFRDGRTQFIPSP